ncbi:hypothetical protein C2E25_09180 [Geothermobacter hydrogeniphilus]|uniref:Metal-dependent peptidase n=1 Tax=Geothermobacter hydrogeniphilus TaxID=1969733 RepID=A0A2K2HA37_9BACT|nr:VWA-like domain-containing protein [Geothermobacter hydrogeniphilus]PNU20079.1 hypothetical protein C2E25_09180 [Geothermobacter hydrogeniphilus]
MEILQNAIIRMLKRRPFYGQLLLACDRRGGDAESFGLHLQNGTPVLTCGDNFLKQYPLPVQEALLEHLLLHLLHLHPARGKGRHPLVWDIACDLAINPSIESLPEYATLPEAYDLPDGLAAEEYEQLLLRRFGLGNQRGEGQGNADRSAAGSDQLGTGEDNQELEQAARQRNRLDSHRDWPEADSTPLRLAEQVVRQLVRDAHRKSDGTVPAGLEALVAGYLAPPAIPWREVLRQFVATAGRVGRTGTWKREHRRFGHETPGQRKRRRLNLLVGIDVSDSTMVPELRENFARELLQIARGRDSRLTVLYSGSRIQQIRRFSSSNVVHEVFHGGGFTDLRPVFDYAREMRPQPAAIIYLTDGYGEAPETMKIPTLWVLTADGRKPADWGVELRLGDET